jgi:hypothetical protein
MSSVTVCLPARLPHFALHNRFLAILPRIERHGRICFRDVRCPHRKEEALQEMRALAWRWFVRLIRKGKDPAKFPSALAVFAARRIRSGRLLAHHERTRDAMSPRAQRMHSFTVERLQRDSSLSGTPYAEALRDNSLTPPPDQAAFRHDFPAWRRTRSERDRRIIDALMVGDRGLDIARRHGLTPARVSQLRRDFYADWARYCGDNGEA